ncbi:hypothetical protein GFB49_10075 [Epibacterium sp. SM1979]|uniref:Uncharacterized protein n=1 Tax=Tritonibacter litoralis TaxID=2662264 RepID=A0A843YCZ6_9RHOB|nr:hypothetical protein [Tritonibacter litoralis]MQQ08801.1 hypothetical protein [Tritonibacter litoralis]
MNGIVALNLEGYVLFFGVLAVVLVVLFWFLSKREKNVRTEYLNQFDPSELRMTPYKIGLVYRVVETHEDAVTVVPVWNGKSKLEGAAETRVEHGVLIPFDATRFL